ncbi:MAG: YfcC family protein [Bacilli bacterium]|nr:YfcC family protein [Bacilli bacterium]
MEKNEKRMLSAYSIIIILIFILGFASHLLPQAKFVSETLVDGSGVIPAKISDILMSPILGFADAIDVCIFVIVLGGFLAIIEKTEALETGIKVLVQKLKGKETILIPILMFIFSIGGTTYGMLEETVGFYALLSATMVAAGMDTLVASSIVLLGAGSGVLGSTINPFAVGAAVSALPDGMAVNHGIIIALGTILWLTTYGISTYFVMKYAKKVQKDKGSTFLSLQEQEAMKKTYKKAKEVKTELTGAQKLTLWLFGGTFAIMIIGFIPWGDFNIDFFEFTGLITGSPLGEWYFYESTLWFLLMSIVISFINGYKEYEFVDTFIEGTKDMISVALIIAVARGASVLMQTTHLDNYIIYNASEILRNMPAVVFGPLNYLLHVVLSVLVPSSSGLASLSTPIMGPLAANLGYSVETTIMTFVAANGLVNLITPTCGAIMGGLALAKVEYTTWVKWAAKVVATIAVVNIIIITIAMAILH